MQVYVVKSGDTLYRIAQRNQIPMEDIIYANQLQAPGVLSVGQALILPDPRTHTVQKGESLYTIAKEYNVGLQELIDANPQLQDPDVLRPGQVIRLPEGNAGAREIIANGYFTNVSNRTLEESLPSLTFLSAFSFRTDEEGTLSKAFDVDLSLSERNGVRNLMTVTNLKEKGGFSSQIAHVILTRQQAQDALVDNILRTLQRYQFFGVNLDLEYVFPYDRQSYNQFLVRLADTLHRRGYLLVTALAPKVSDDQQGLLYEAHDYAFHGQVADFNILMTYEWGYTYGPAMAVSPVDQVRKVLEYAVTEIPSEKILMGIPNYGYDWTLPFVQGSAARPLTNVRAVTLAGEVGAEILFDQKAQSPNFRYTAADGRQHEVWFEDVRSIQAKLDLVEEYDLGGVSFWNLNNLFRTNFYALDRMYRVIKSV